MSKIYNINLNSIVSREEREKKYGYKSIVLWFTGMSGSGKSTLAYALEERLHNMGCITYVLDSDNLEYGLNSDLTSTNEDRKENIRRMAHVSKQFLE
jgi:adenylylsulfate kinase